MSETPDVVVTSVPDRRSLWARNKNRLVKGGAIAGAVLIVVAFLKRKLNGSCDVAADVHVESDKTDS